MPTVFRGCLMLKASHRPVDDQLRYALPFPFPGKHGHFSKARHPRALLGSLLFVFLESAHKLVSLDEDPVHLCPCIRRCVLTATAASRRARFMVARSAS
jgi:hypothetical protein